MRAHSSQRPNRKTNRHREIMAEKRFQQPGMIQAQQLSVVGDSMSSYPQAILHDPSTTFGTTFNGSSTPTLGGAALGYHGYNSYHPSPATNGGTPTTPSAPSIGSMTMMSHGLNGTLLRPTATLHTATGVPPLSGHPSISGFNGMPPPHPSHPSLSSHQQQAQPPALISSPLNERLHLPVSVSTPHRMSGPPTLNSGGPGSSRIIGGPATLNASLPYMGTPRLQPPTPGGTMPSIPTPAGMPGLQTSMEAGTPTGAMPLPILTGPGQMHSGVGGQQFVQVPQPNYQQDRIPFELDYPPHGLYFRCLLDAKLVGGLIGKKGQSIEHIRKTSGAKIHIAKKLPNQQPIMRLVTVSGVVKNVVQALQLIADKIAVANQDGSLGTGTGENSHILTLLVDEKNVGCLIGKNGNTINNIRKKTGANVFISSHLMPHSTEKCIDVNGNKENMDRALEAICQQFVNNPKYVHTRNEYNPQASLFGTNAYMYPAMPPLFSNHSLGRGDLAESVSSPVGFPGSPNSQTVSITYRVDKGHVGGIIGRGGRNIAEIRRQSQANVMIDNDQSSPHRTVTLRGTRSEVALAVQLLQHAIAINHNHPRDTRT